MSTQIKRGNGLDQALAGLHVLELASGTAASFGGYVLAQYGAQVTKIEPLTGDPQRLEHPLVNTADGVISASFLAHQRGKSSRFLDLGSLEGRNELEQLLAEADVVISQGLPEIDGTVLEYERIRAINPRLIFTVITPFGLSGPYAGYQGGDLVAAAMSGFVYLTGEPNQQPVRMGSAQALKLAGAEAAAGTMVAVFERDRSDEGQQVDVAIRDAMIRATVNAVPRYEYEGVVQDRVGDHWGVRSRPLRALWACKDGWVSFVRRGGALGGRVNEQTVQWMEESGMAVSELHDISWDELDLGNEEHRAILDRLDVYFMEFLRERKVDEVFTEGLRRGITLAPVRRISQILDEQHLADRDFWTEQPLAASTAKMPGAFVRVVVQPEVPGTTEQSTTRKLQEATNHAK